MEGKPQLSQIINPDDPEHVFKETKNIFLSWYSALSFMSIHHVFKKVEALFTGDFPGYKACNTEYHNLGHTIDILLAAARTMDGRNLSETPFDETFAKRLFTAALLHDTGYIQEEGDTAGTGAKYTSEHVDRSCEFVLKNAEILALEPDDVKEICVIISCTDLQKKWDKIPFSSDESRKAGTILASADLIGQMSSRAYLEKLLLLYYEFQEAGIPGYKTEFDMLRKTSAFYETVKTRLDTILLSSYSYAQIHFRERKNVDANLYIEAIERQMLYLKAIIDDSSSNFRHKLKRTDFINAEAKPDTQNSEQPS